MIAILDRKFLLELLQNLLFAFCVISTIALLGIASIAFFRFGGLDLALYLALVRCMVVQALSYLLPLSMLIATVFVYGRAAADHEFTTLCASGIHPWRALLPGALVALLLALPCFEVESSLGPSALFELRALPASQSALRPLLASAIASGRKSATFDDRGGSCTLTWNETELPPEGGVVLRGVLLELEPRQERAHAAERTVVTAKSAELRFDESRREIELVLADATVLAGALRELQSERTVIRVAAGSEAPRMQLKFQSSPELLALQERAGARVDVGGSPLPLLRRFTAKEVEGRLYERLARAASPLAFLLLGFPLALLFRSGNRMVAFLLATLVALFVYYPADLLGDAMLNEGLASPLVATWGGDALMAALGVLLLFRVRR